MLHEGDNGTSGVKPDLSQDRVSTRKNLVRDFGIPAPTFHIPKGAAFLFFQAVSRRDSITKGNQETRLKLRRHHAICRGAAPGRAGSW